MTDEEWAARLRDFDQHREAHARTLNAFRAQVEAARRILGRVIRQLERKPRSKRTWSARAQRAGPRWRGTPPVLAAAGRETPPPDRTLFVAGEVDRGGRQGRSTGG